MPNGLPEQPVQLTLRLPPRLVTALALTWALVVAGFIYFPTWQPAIVFAASSLGGLAGLAGALYLARGLILTAQQRQNAERQERVKEAFHYMERWNSPHFYHTRTASREILRLGTAEGAERVKTTLAGDAALRSNAMDVMNFFEEMAIAIDLNIADDQILKRAFRGLVAAHWMTLEPFVNERRRVLGNPKLLIECEALHKRWA